MIYDQGCCGFEADVLSAILAPYGLRGCKNGPDPFPGRMSYKATKPGLAVCHMLACFYCVVVY